MRTIRRSSITPWLMLAAIGVGLGSGCGGDDDDDQAGADSGAGGGADAGAGAGPVLDELSGELADVLCPRLLDCCSSADLRELFEDGVSPDVPTDVPGCVAALAAPLDEIVGSLADSVAAGRLQYSAERMDACLTVLAEISCDRFGGELADLTAFSACEPPFTGLVADGGACEADHECTSRNCAGRGDGEPGACAALPAEGDACPESRCADDLYCDSIGSTCIPQKPDGDPCASADECLSGDCVDDVCGATPVCDGQD